MEPCARCGVDLAGAFCASCGEPAGAERTPGRGVGGLVLNAFIWPGLGSLVMRKGVVGWAQGALALAGAAVALVTALDPTAPVSFLAGAVVAGMAWLWGLATSVGALLDGE